jgi:hypothetical protein
MVRSLAVTWVIVDRGGIHYASLQKIYAIVRHRLAIVVIKFSAINACAFGGKGLEWQQARERVMSVACRIKR